ncbi:UNVERIFIED_CONTAM: hypothetical protein Sradi_0478700 [Sesamum radiatum]|uniref:Uncharacterized protein n=1 Tax=Sesamum radiatum TaxID=300843 RepID=A0AAW2W888_SESRA
METNKFNGTNYNDWLRNLRIVLDFKNQGYVLDKPLPAILPEGSSPEERLTARNSMRTIARYAATKAFFGTKMAEGSSVQSHGVKMLSLVEKLKDLKAGLNNDTYIDVILQSLPPSYDPFIVNFNMNEFEKKPISDRFAQRLLESKPSQSALEISLSYTDRGQIFSWNLQSSLHTPTALDKAYNDHASRHSHRSPYPRYSLHMHATVMIPQIRGLILYYQNQEFKSYLPSPKRLPYGDSRESLKSVDYLVNQPTKTAQTTYVSCRRNTAAVLSASLYRTLDAQSRGPQLGTFQTDPQELVS